MTEPTNDNPQLSLGAIIASLPAVKVAKKANTMSRVHRRLIEPIETEQDNEPQLAFQHTVFCQTSLPYRNPGDDVRKWKRTNGSVVLQLEAGDAWNPRIRRLRAAWLAVGNEAAPDLGSPQRRSVAPRFAGHRGREQPVRIREADSRFRRRARNSGIQRPAFPIIGCRLSGLRRHAATERFRSTQRLSPPLSFGPNWTSGSACYGPRQSSLSLEYFNSLQEHAVPLNEADLAALAHSALALDLYSWLAQRLHRINPEPARVHPMARAQAAIRPRLRRYGQLQRQIPCGPATGSGPLQSCPVRDRRLRNAAVQQPAPGHKTAGACCPLNPDPCS